MLPDGFETPRLILRPIEQATRPSSLLLADFGNGPPLSTAFSADTFAFLQGTASGSAFGRRWAPLSWHVAT